MKLGGRGWDGWGGAGGGGCGLGRGVGGGCGRWMWEMGSDGLERKRMVERDNCPWGTFLRSTVMVLIPMSGPTYMWNHFPAQHACNPLPIHSTHNYSVLFILQFPKNPIPLHFQSEGISFACLFQSWSGSRFTPVLTVPVKPSSPQATKSTHQPGWRNR